MRARTKHLSNYFDFDFDMRISGVQEVLTYRKKTAALSERQQTRQTTKRNLHYGTPI